MTPGMLLAGGGRARTRPAASTSDGASAPPKAPQGAKAKPRAAESLTPAEARREWKEAFDAYRVALGSGDVEAKADAVQRMRSALDRARKGRTI